MVHTLISLVLVGLFSLGNGGLSSPLTSPSLGALPGAAGLFAGTPPELGVRDGQLSPCPESPNCVVSQNADADHAIAPLSYSSDRETARATVLKVLTVVPRTQVIEQTADYIRFASSSRLLGFVDDGEFYFPADENLIQMRSASRLGESDLGINRRRMEQIRLALRDLGA
ncbi:DUF1499 domain-containing protein [Acaryochloris sp. IP29b_bin.137]|uniref:DUF1499 domain-containing protein n=1 Tax=Acaryochloris sp. IP29b_bin.137 TaxID=2969217 RepID=UPI002602B2DB|nr:DUF1499 domain-containing protein [Acaryochloris sp. IP29b_bin.137]